MVSLRRFIGDHRFSLTGIGCFHLARGTARGAALLKDGDPKA
jgi:hypothetical protein